MKTIAYVLLGVLVATLVYSVTGWLAIPQARTVNARDPSTLAIRDGTIVDLTDGSLKQRQTIVISGDSISAVGTSADVAIPAGSRIVEAKGKFLIPGLWDMHVHTTDPASFPLFVANGVTGIRDMGGGAEAATDGCESVQSEQIKAWRSRIEADQLIGPRIVLSGPPASGTGWPTSLPVRTTDEARAAVRTLQARGVDFVKVYEGIPPVAYQALADAAHEAGLPLAGHVPETVGLLDAIMAGQRSIEHVRDALLMCFTDYPGELARFMADDHWTEEDVTWGCFAEPRPTGGYFQHPWHSCGSPQGKVAYPRRSRRS